MRIELTISAGERARDVAVVAAPGLRLAAVATQLCALLELDPAARLWSGERLLGPDAQIGGPGLRTGALIRASAPRRDRARAGVLSLHVVAGPASGRVVPLDRGRLVIGRGSGCTLVLADDGVSREHAVLTVGASEVRLTDEGSTNGTFVDDEPVGAAGVRVAPGQVIRVGDTLLCLRGPDDPPAALGADDSGDVLINRAPRRVIPIEQPEIVLPQRNEVPRPGSVQWIAALLPAAAGGALAWFLHSTLFLLFALLTPIMMLSTSLGDRVHWRRSRRQAARSHARRLAAAEREVSAGLTIETAARRANAPDPAAVWRLAIGPSSRLWERRRADADFLHVRVATANLPSALQVRADGAGRAAGVIAHVPVGVQLRAGPLGVAGPPEVLAGLGRWLAGQLGALHSPADLRLALLLSADQEAAWRWTRWLPHLSRVASSPAGWADLVAELSAQRLGGRTRADGTWPGPWTVLIIDRCAQLCDIAGLTALLADGRAAGVTAICLDADERALPTQCAAVARVRGDTGTRVGVRLGDKPEFASGLLDTVAESWAESVARALAPLIDAGSGGAALPDSCRLRALLGLGDLVPEALAARWAASSGRPDTTLGVAADGPLRIDLVADGPHALIAGTTGAGKSELLQTLVTGLAVEHPPDEVTFLLIDYKGGAAFAACARLPHTAGVVTDLDPHLTRRALQSLQAELRRRERLLAAVGVADLDAYRRSAATEPLPRMIIVVDEFATLAEELPDFVTGLIGVAQRGRSLGVHLVLATQRPGSAVSPEIRANSSLRIALRVTGAAESSDIIDEPVAATIDRAVPGRAYVRTGTTLTCLQTARIGGLADASAAGASAAGAAAQAAVVVPLAEWRSAQSVPADTEGASDLELVVSALNAAAELAGRARTASPWLAPLPERLPLAELADKIDTGAVVAIGLVDLPAEQRQEPLVLELAAGGSTLVVGASRSGRTGALATVALAAAASRGPERLQLYVIDASGALVAGLTGLPHLATGLGPGGLDTVPALLRRLEQLVARRQAGTATSGGGGSLILLVVDGWDVLLAGMSDAEAGRCADRLTALQRASAAAGLTIVLSGDRTLLTPRIAGSFGQRLLLRQNDPTDFAVAGIATRDLPSAFSPGRGLRAVDGALFQLAHTGAEPGPGAVPAAVCDLAERFAGHLLEHDAVRIRALPARVRLDEVDRSGADLPKGGPSGAGLAKTCLTTSERAEDARAALRLGIGGDEAEPVLLRPFTGGRRLLVAGPPRSGRSTTLATLLVEAVRAGLPVLAAATGRSAVRVAARRHAVAMLDPAMPAHELIPPAGPTLVLVDDCDAFLDTPAGDLLAAWARDSGAGHAVVVAGRTDDLATSYRGVAAEVRRNQCGLLLRPGPIDGELVGIRLPRRLDPGPPGRGVLVGEPAWGERFADGAPVPIQVAICS